MIAHIAALALLASSTPIHAFSAGPGSCNSPIPVQGAHVASNPDGNGALQDFDIVVTIDNVELDPMAVNDFEANEGLSIQIVAQQGQFAGFLMKLYDPSETEDAADWLAATGDADSVAACTTAGAASIGHTNSDPKSSAGGDLEVDVIMDGLTLEVTVVVSNDATGAESVWYSTAYNLNAVAGGGTGGGTGGGGPPTPPVVDTPAPVMMDTPAPVAPDTAAPVAPDTAAPVEVMTKETFAPITKAPDTMAPVTAEPSPAEMPVEAPAVAAPVPDLIPTSGSATVLTTILVGAAAAVVVVML